MLDVMISPALSNTNALRGIVLGSSFYKASDRIDRSASATARTTAGAGWQGGEKNSATLPELNIKYSARALRCADMSPSRPRLHPGEQVGVYENRKGRMTGAYLAQVACVNTEANTVVVELDSGEMKEFPASAVFDKKLMHLVCGMGHSGSPHGSPPDVFGPVSCFNGSPHGSPRSAREGPTSPRSVQLPKMPNSAREPGSAQMRKDPSDVCLPSPGKIARKKNKKRQSMASRGNADFHHGKLTQMAHTLGEVHLLLSRSEARSGPPCDAKAFKNALLKKFERLDVAWEEMDTNGDGLLDFNEFTRACRSISFAGNFKMIFQELTKGGDTFKPELLDPNLPDKLEAMRVGRLRKRSKEAGVVEGLAAFIGTRTTEGPGDMHLTSPLKTFKNALVKKFNHHDGHQYISILGTAWDEIDTNCDGLVDFIEFTRACRTIQFKGNLKQIFKDFTDGEDTMRPEVLDDSLPAELEKLRSNRVQGAPQKGSGATFDQTMHGSAATLGEVHMKMQRAQTRAGPPCDARAFKLALIKKFGKYVQAWQEIDGNGDGLLQYDEFVRACRSIQFNGNFKKIFQELTGGEECLRPELLDASLPAELLKLRKASPR